MSSVPGLVDQPEGLVALVLAIFWIANATVAAGAAERGLLGVLVVLEAIFAVMVAARAGWRHDSGMTWLWGNLISSLLAGAGLILALRARAGGPAMIGARRFWRLAWPLILLALVGNGAVALLRAMVFEPFRLGPI